MLKLRFLGTGAADWNGPDERGEHRRLTSLLIDGRVLVDFTADKLDVFGGPVDTVLITHSHSDHYDPSAIAQLKPGQVWVQESWAEDAAADGLPVRAARFGEWIDLGEGLRAMSVPANHSTARAHEQTSGYLFEKNGLRFLYMTDSAWIPRGAANLIGKEPLDAMAIDATIGPECPDDWRVFEHTSVEMAGIMVRSMLKSGRLRQGAPVFLTHMARTLWPGQKAAEEMTPAPFVVCYDGLEADIGEEKERICRLTGSNSRM